jgi:hypothetical protein
MHLELESPHDTIKKVLSGPNFSCPNQFALLASDVSAVAITAVLPPITLSPATLPNRAAMLQQAAQLIGLFKYDKRKMRIYE